MSKNVNTQLMSMLDRVERSLPGLPRTVFRLQRKLAEAGIEASRSAFGVLGYSSDHTTRLEDRTKADLYERAQELDVSGRSTMTKAELVNALQQA